MADRVGIYAGWEWKGFYYGKQASWGGADPAASVKVIENTGNFPPKYEHKDIGVRPTGRGLPYDVTEDMHLGRGGVTGYTTEFDLTATIWRDIMLLLYQGTITDNTTYYTIAPYTANGPTVSLFGSLFQYAYGGADTNPQFGGYNVESAVPVSATLTIPMSEPDSEGSICTMSVDWIGRSAERITTISIPTPTEDNSAKILGHEPTFTFGAQAYNILEMSVTFTNNATLSGEGSSDGYAPRVIRGKMGWSGNVKCFVEDATASLSEALATGFRTKAPVAVVGTLSTNNVFRIPIQINDQPQMEDVDGGKAINFGFITAGDADGGAVISFDVLKDTGNSDDSPWAS